MSIITIARRFLVLAAMDGDTYPGRLGYWARAAHRAGISLDEITETYGLDKADVEAMLREEGNCE